MKNKLISGNNLTLQRLEDFLAERPAIQLTEAARTRMHAARRLVQQKIDLGETIYGINTGFGKLAQVKIPTEDLQHLQLNLLRSHACGVGEAIEPEIVALMLLPIALARSGGTALPT